MPLELFVFVNSFFFYLGTVTLKASWPLSNRPGIFRNKGEMAFLILAAFLVASYAGFVIWTVFKIVWYIDAVILIASFLISPLVFHLIPPSVSQSALGLIIPAVFLPFLAALAYNNAASYEPQWVPLVIGVGGIFLAIRLRRRGNAFGAAMNVLMAKHTFSQLGSDQQVKVNNQAKTILERDWRYPTQESTERLQKMRPVERYGFYALAMAELRIEPLFAKERWSYVKNPFIALIRFERYVTIAHNFLKDRYGKEVTLD